MLLAAVIVGGLTAYWLGLRAGLWAAGAALLLLVVADWMPLLALPIYLLLAVGVIGVCLVGSRKGRAIDVIPTARWLRATLGQAASWLRSGSTRANGQRKRDDDRR